MTKVNNLYSSSANIRYGVLEGSALGPLLLILIFAIYFCGIMNVI